MNSIWLKSIHEKQPFQYVDDNVEGYAYDLGLGKVIFFIIYLFYCFNKI